MRNSRWQVKRQAKQVLNNPPVFRAQLAPHSEGATVDKSWRSTAECQAFFAAFSGENSRKIRTLSPYGNSKNSL
jgi:hypothetical protein